jgi:hypothetical protein
MPYDVGAKLNRLQHLKWLTDGDETLIAEKLQEVMSTGQAPPEAPELEQDKAAALSADGLPSPAKDQLACPLPSFDASWLKSLDAQGGPVRLESPFYVSRPDDETCKQRVGEKGHTLLIRGGRQIGKSSLLARLYQHTRDAKLRTVYIDFRVLDQQQLQSLDVLLLSIANQIYDDLSPNNEPQSIWKNYRSSGQNLTRYLQTEIIGTNPEPVVLFMDEVDRILTHDYRDDFFALIRYWHDGRARDSQLALLNLILAYSTEAALFIQNLNQSPFNVGQVFELADFTKPHFEDLNFKHGSPVKKAAEIDTLMQLLGGHPFLVRQALYELAISQISVVDLIARAAADDGPFSSHLQSYLLGFRKYSELKQPMKSVLHNGTCPDDVSFYRLRSIGLVRGSDRTRVTPRCGLYQHYFGAHL